MALHHDLLRQARMLSRHEPRKPRQASLRRAVSAAYYSLFHLLTHEATARLVTGPGRDDLRITLRRAFEHGLMKEVCKEIVKPNSGRLSKSLGGSTIPAQLRDVAQSFVDLQQARHDADYDMGRKFTRDEAIELVVTAERAAEKWIAIRKSIPADVFLCALLAFRGMCR